MAFLLAILGGAAGGIIVILIGKITVWIYAKIQSRRDRRD